MTRTQGVFTVMSGVLVLLAWLSSGGRVAEPQGAAPTRRATSISADPALDLVPRQLARLRDRQASPAPLGGFHRNPFRFQVPVAPDAPRAARPRKGGRPAESEAPAVPRPEMRLLGITEDVVDGHAMRIAIVSAAGQLCLLREGERLLGRYEVVRIAPDAVSLEDGGERFTLALR